MARRARDDNDVEATVRSLLEELRASPADSFATQIDVLNELNRLCRSYNLLRDLEAIWDGVGGLLGSDDPGVRKAVWNFMIACVEGNHDNLGPLRIVFFRTVEGGSRDPADLSFAVQLLARLTLDGRDISGMDGDVAVVLHRWISLAIVSDSKDKSGHPSVFAGSDALVGEVLKILNLISNILKFSAPLLDTAATTSVLCDTCTVAQAALAVLFNPTEYSAAPQEVITVSLQILDVAVRYASVPFSALEQVVRLLCKTVNLGSSFDSSWAIMRNLLKSHCAYTAVNLMCEIMDPGEDRGGIPLDESVVRGAVLFVGMACWGAQRVQTLLFTYGQLLPSMIATLAQQSEIVDHEVLLSVNRLVKKYGGDLTVLEWNCVLEVLQKLRRHCYMSSDRDFGVTWRLGDDVDSSGAGQSSIVQLYNSLLVATRSHLSTGAPSVSAELDVFYDLVLELARGPSVGGGRARSLSGGGAPAQPAILSQGIVSGMLDYFHKSGRLNLLDPAGIDLFSTICVLFFVVDQRPRIRAQVLAMLERLYAPSVGTGLVDRILLPHVFARLPEETDPQIAAGCLQLLAAALGDGFGGSATDAHFHSFVGLLFDCASSSSPVGAQAAAVLADTFVACFQGRQPARFAPTIFLELVKFLGRTDANAAARLETLKLLAQLRADRQHRVRLEGLRGRRLRGVMPAAGDDASAPSEGSMLLFSAVVSFREEEGSTKGQTVSFGDDGMQDDLASDTTKRQPDGEEAVGQSDVLLPVSAYVEQLTALMRAEKDWDVFSAVVVLLPKQLANFTLFRGCRVSLNALRAGLCESITSDLLAPQLVLAKGAKRADVYLQAYRLLTSLMPYKGFFAKAGLDDMVLAFQLGLTKWPTTARPCVHSLLQCLHEVPSSMVKFLPNTLVRMAQVISTTSLSVHILEFLSVLARMPSLYSNFVEADFKRVFGIALHYIQHSSAVTSAGQVSAPNSYALGQFVIYLSYHVVTVWFMNLPVRERRRYVPFIVHYLALANGPAPALDERIEVLVDMLLRYAYSNSQAKPQRGLLDELLFGELSATSQVISRSWAQGGSLVTARTIRSLGWCELTVRRPSGTAKLLIRLENRLKGEEADFARALFPMAHLGFETVDDLALISKAVQSTSGHPQQESASDRTNHTSTPYPFKDDNLLDPGFVMSQLSTYPDLSGRAEDSTRALPDDDGTTRAIAVLDRIPVVDFHKIGVVYLGPGQTTEGEILRNRRGSAAYHRFLAGLGSFNRLRDLKDVYTGGLDISQDLDGEYGLFFEDEGSQIAFHVTTLMPNTDGDESCTSKKRHIGNDYVLIVFNESGVEYEFRTIPSQFNFVNFVVAPILGESGPAPGRGSDVPHLFSVTMQRREDMPDFGPLADTKVVSSAALSPLVRQLATHADTFAQIFYLNSSGVPADWISNWRERLRQIKRARER
ncbi:hypothetical protein DFJ74DRAFT_614470, partial [Hyaloraphidium curvatum]